MSKNNVLSDIISQTSTSGPLYVQNDRPIRDFVALDDVVNALIMTAATIFFIYQRPEEPLLGISRSSQ